MTLFGPEQREAFQNYIRSGGGFAGIHSATDTEYDWDWYGELVGAYFANHPRNPNVRNAIVRVADPNHPSTEHLPAGAEREAESYNLGYTNPATAVLLMLDTDSHDGRDEPANHPISWDHHCPGRRTFST